MDILTEDKAREVLHKLCGYAKPCAAAYLTDSASATTRFANSAISQNVSVSDTTVCLTVYDGCREASCSGNIMTDEGLRTLAENAKELLREAPEGEFGFFPAPDIPVPARVYDGTLARRYNAETRADTVRQGVAGIKPGYSAAGAFALDSFAHAYCDTHGGFRYGAFDICRFNTVVTHASGAAGAGECCAFMPDGADIPRAFAQAQATAEAARDPVSVKLGPYTVVLSPLAFGELIYYACMMLNAKKVEDGESYAIGQMGARVFSECITLRDDVTQVGTRPIFFDTEGNARQPLTLVENGILRNLLYDNKTAARQQRRSTGHAFSRGGSGSMGGAFRNLVMNAGGRALSDIIRDTPYGIFINEFHYTNLVSARSLQLTGLTRNGAFLIEDGVITKPVATMRFTQSVLDALGAVTDLSKDRSWVGNTDEDLMYIPAARLDGFHFTSQP